MEYQVVHEIPGRVRLRLTDPALVNGRATSLGAYLAARPGVRSVRFNANAQSVVLSYDDGCGDDVLATLADVSLEQLGEEEEPAGAPEPGWSWTSTTNFGLASAAAVLGMMTNSLLTGGLVAAAALPIFQRALESLREKGKLNVDVLDAAATGVLAAQGSIGTAAAMVWLVSLGDFIRDLTVHQSRRAVESLFDGNRGSAWVVRDGRKIRVAIDELREGDEVVVYPGELVPVDGTVLAGRALVDQKMLTGESIPVEKEEGATVYAATVVSDGKLYLRATKVGAETVASKIVQSVREAPVRQTRIQNYAEQFADRLVPWSVAGAGGALAVTGTADMAAGLLIIDYGTGIRVAAPTTVLASIARAARRGILIKGGRHLERLAEVDAVVFDKTGTLSVGTPELVALDSVADDVGPDTVLVLAAAAEARLSHPVARAIARAAQLRGLAVPERESSRYAVGLGVEASIAGGVVHVGSERFMELHGVDVAPARERLEWIAGQPVSPLFVARDGRLVGVLVYADPIRPEAAAVVRALRDRGIARIVMVTGDQPAVAARVAREIDVDVYVGGAFPEQKVEIVRALQRAGRTVAVVGDGINDSPALAQADVGIAVRGGTDIAREAAHVALLEGNLSKLVQAFDIARDSMRLIRQNWDMLVYPNSAAIVLSVLQLIGPVGATLISNGSAIAASVNALRPLLGADGA